MPMTLKKRIKEALLQRGFDFRRRQPDEMGHDPYRDLSYLLDVATNPILFDVGANVGQTVASIHERFNSPVIHAFEPSPATFEKLKQRTNGIPNLILNNFAVGAHPDQRLLFENVHPTFSSFLPTGKDGGSRELTGQVMVDINTIDSYCHRAGITRIDVLKSDTQGFDYEVLKGAIGMLQEHRIHFLLIELQFLESYVGAPQFEEVYGFLKSLGFLPMAFYKQLHHGSHYSPLAEIDGLFVDPQWRRV
ncbi:FkbM family methyltransferase [Acidicapsa acidisoli]|uniref:FkbM family methyltransferase n=1 Tax=Acidicapsa acidisoli TaxID=1615681 RepID=UPI0021DFD982|nr:FkbM family methyltransferase [Acidicapsa acidisoli]